MTSLWRDLRFALRSLVQAPAFTLIALLTLGLGVGANTAIFSVVDAVVLRPLPYPQPEQLVWARESNRQFPAMSVSYPDFLDWAADNHSFSGLAVFRGNDAVLTHAGPPVLLRGLQVTSQYFPVLGVKPEIGRPLRAEEDRPGAPEVVMLADALWRRRFGADPAVIGRAIQLDAKPYTVVGVMPPGFPGLQAEADAPQFWVAAGAQATQDSGVLERGNHPGFNGLGRLKPGVDLAQARADLAAIAHALAQQYPKSNTGEGVVVRSYLDSIVGNTRPALLLLLAAVGLVLLIACANVANLLLARAATRRKANAIRSALGASRARLIREHLTESLCLGVGGGILGLALAWLAMRAVPLLIPPGVSRAGQVALDFRVLAFTMALALVTSVVFGLAPAWHASHAAIAEVLKQGGRESAAGGSGNGVRSALVALEMALALVLLVGAGLLIRSLMQLQRVDPGFDPHHVLTFGVGLPEAKYPTLDQKLAFFRQATERFSRLPGVLAVGGADPLPFSGNDWESGFTIVGRPAPAPGNGPSANMALVSGNYFHAMGIRLLRGRAFGDTDTSTSPLVGIVDDRFARQYWPGPDPLAAALGQQVRANGETRVIVGVVGHVRPYHLDEESRVEVFLPQAQAGGAGDNSTFFTLRTGLADPLQLRAAVLAQIQAVDPDQPIANLFTMDQRLDLSLAQRRLALWLMGAFALLALALAAIGIYGVISYAVAQRTHEIGIRMALGAGRPGVLALVLAQGLRLALIGAAAGLAAAVALGRFAVSFLYGVTWADPLTLLAVPLLLIAIAGLACYLPARRATQVDPVIALRGE